MSKIYLINVGSNLADSSSARSPVFDDGSFEFVSFPDDQSPCLYPPNAKLFVKPGITRTHLDPDWNNLTYGDFCKNARASSLLSVEINDILLFWGLLWRIRDRSTSVWESKERKWYLFGALRVAAILETGENLKTISNAADRKRLTSNAHVQGDRVEGRPRVRVFLGEKNSSKKFNRAVDLGIYEERSLLRQTVRAADGRSIEWESSPKWNSVTRACRAILDLGDREHLVRAKILQKAIKTANPDYDLLAGLP